MGRRGGLSFGPKSLFGRQEMWLRKILTRLGIQADEEEEELGTQGASLGPQALQQLQHQCPETPGRLSRRSRQESPGTEWTAESPGCQEWQVLDLVIQWGTEAGLLGTVWAEHHSGGYQVWLGLRG